MTQPSDLAAENADLRASLKTAHEERIWTDSGSREADFSLARRLREESIEAHTVLSQAGVECWKDQRPLTLAERVGIILAQVQTAEQERDISRLDLAEAEAERDGLKAELSTLLAAQGRVIAEMTARFRSGSQWIDPDVQRWVAALSTLRGQAS